jgi:Uma2 family endonuclease
MTRMLSEVTQNQVICNNLQNSIDTYFNNHQDYLSYKNLNVIFLKNINSLDSEIVTIKKTDICVISSDKNEVNHNSYYGIPHLIIETISLTNTREVMIEKFELYEKVGVREYWIVGLEQNFVLVYYLNEQGKYIGIKPFSQEETFNSVIFPELEVDLNKVFE